MANTMPPPPPLAISVGELVLDRYRVVEQIASGGHSVVYRGTDERLSRPVCIKVFSGFGGESGVGRTSYEHFVQEAFALSRLTHPNTLRIYDFGHLGTKTEVGMPLQVCEYMNGGTLSQIIREDGKQSLGETTRIAIAMCAALGEAHGLGIVHRDIKPQNILFTTLGAVRLPKLADFGIAKWSSDAEEQRSSKRAEDTAIVAGQKLAMYSPSWAAPEQLAGQPVSAATDIYSLACVMVYMLSGKAIFADEDVYAGYKKRREADELIRDALRPVGVPERVIQLMTRALAFDPKRRPAAVEELSGPLAEDSPVWTNTPTNRFSAVTPSAPVITIESDDPIIEVEQPIASEAPAAATAATPPTPPTAPTAPAAPKIEPSWLPPALVSPWMAVEVPQHSSHAHRLMLSDTPIHAVMRRVHFVMAANGIVDLTGTQNSRIRVTLLPGPSGRIAHIKGLTCFVSVLGGRPSPAVHLEHGADLALVTPRAQEIGHVRVATGTSQTGTTVFPLGSEWVAVSFDDCLDPILFDFGPGSDAYLVYTRGRALPKRR